MFGLSTKALIAIGGLVVLIVLIGFAHSGDADADTGSGPCTFTVTADILNVREGPSTDDAVVDRLRHGTTVAAQQTVKDGFRKIADHRWSSQKFLQATDASGC